jgi:predicted nuclease of predicted toxin-antitoxin system
MILLFDHHLSPRLVGMLADIFPASLHVRGVGLARETDRVIWQYAKNNQMTIVSKDADFHQLSFVYGPPPKVVWIRCGSVTTNRIADILRQHATDITEFHADDEAAYLVISG